MEKKARKISKSGVSGSLNKSEFQSRLEMRSIYKYFLQALNVFSFNPSYNTFLLTTVLGGKKGKFRCTYGISFTLELQISTDWQLPNLYLFKKAHRRRFYCQCKLTGRSYCFQRKEGCQRQAEAKT